MEIAKVVPLPNIQMPWGVVVDGELFGYSKARYDADFAVNVINMRGLDVYMRFYNGGLARTD